MSKSIKLIREQKEEYMDHLFDLVYEPVYRHYQSLYQNVCQSKEGMVKGVLKTFQKEIAKIPEWNQLRVEQFYEDFLEKTKCTYFVELLKTIYVLSIKLVLLGLPQEHRNKIQIKIPSPDTFLHRLLIHIARDVWKRPYLFYHQVKSVEQQNHLYQFEMIIRRKIRSVIRDTLPIDLMVQHMSSSELLKLEEEASSSSDESSEASDEEEEEESSEEEEKQSTEEDENDEEEIEEESSKEEEIEPIQEATNPVEDIAKNVEQITPIQEEAEPIQEELEMTPEPKPILEVTTINESEKDVKSVTFMEREPETEHETIYEEPPIVRKSLERESSNESIPVIQEAEPQASPKKLIHIQELIRHKKKSHSRPKNAFF
jgi:hypothetical protein